MLGTVTDGTNVAGKLVKLAVARFEDDLVASNQDGCAFYWDSEAASAACDFFPTFLVHTTGCRFQQRCVTPLNLATCSF